MRPMGEQSNRFEIRSYHRRWKKILPTKRALRLVCRDWAIMSQKIFWEDFSGNCQAFKKFVSGLKLVDGRESWGDQGRKDPFQMVKAITVAVCHCLKDYERCLLQDRTELHELLMRTRLERVALDLSGGVEAGQLIANSRCYTWVQAIPPSTQYRFSTSSPPPNLSHATGPFSFESCTSPISFESSVKNLHCVNSSSQPRPG